MRITGDATSFLLLAENGRNSLDFWMHSAALSRHCRDDAAWPGGARKREGGPGTAPHCHRHAGEDGVSPDTDLGSTPGDAGVSPSRHAPGSSRGGRSPAPCACPGGRRAKGPCFRTRDRHLPVANARARRQELSWTVLLPNGRDLPIPLHFGRRYPHFSSARASSRELFALSSSVTPSFQASIACIVAIAPARVPSG